MSGSITALSLAVVLAIFEIGSCTRCFQCNSQQEPACGDPFRSTKPLVECSSPEVVGYNTQTLQKILPEAYTSSVFGAPTACHKIVMQSGTVVRTCLDANPVDINKVCLSLMEKSKMSTDPTTKIKYCSVCDKDGCNGASSITFSLPLATLALIMSYLYCKQ